MNQHSEDSTHRYYEDKAEEYLARTSQLDMESLYKPFLELIPAGGTILDAGCGPGRDVLAFLKQGFRVTAFDASEKMVEIASTQTGVAAYGPALLCYMSLFVSLRMFLLGFVVL